MLVASFLIFSSMFVAPGSIVYTLLGGPENVNAASVAALTERYHLNDPFFVQYWHWLSDAVQGSLGRSYIYGQSVADLLQSRMGTTLWLFAFAYVLIMFLGVCLGAFSGVRRGWMDKSSILVTTFLSAIPPFVAAVALIAVFGVWLRWFPVAGSGQGFLDNVYHFTMPAVALAGVSLAVITRVTRDAVIAAASQEHVDAARMRGFGGFGLLRRHILRNSLGPVVTMGGLILAGMLGGSVLVEQVFGLEGLGSLLVTAINRNDFPVVQAILLLMVGAYIFITMLTDLIYPLLDPRTARPKGST